MTSPPSTPPPNRTKPAAGKRRARLLALLIGAFALVGGLLAPAAMAATGQITIQALDAPPPPKPTGSASAYSINFTCSAVGEQTCGNDPVIRIPLNLTSSNGETPAMPTWAYSASSTNPALIVSQEIVGNEYVIRLDPEHFKPGDSQSIFFTTTPPNNITPDATTWSFAPTLKTEAMPQATVPEAAPGAASAEAKLAVTKVTHDGSDFVVRGHEVIFNITARCNVNGQTGNLHLKNGSLVDTLPAGLSFVSATPAPSSVSGQTITWSYPGTADLPSGCAAGAGGTQSYKVVASIDSSVVNLAKLKNSVTFQGTPIGTSTPVSRDADREITVYDVSPSEPGNFIGKSAVAPLEVNGAGYVGTYPGNWIPDVGSVPSIGNPGSAAGRFTVSVNYPASGAYTTDLIDPMPCLTAPSPANRYNSSAVTGPTSPTGEPTIDQLCADPAFHPTVVRVEAPRVSDAHDDNDWRPKGITTDGTSFDLETLPAGGTIRYYAVPAAHVGDVAAIRLVPDPALSDAWMRMDVFGYADESTEGGEVLHNIVSGTAYPVSGGGNPVTGADSAEILIEDEEPQLGVYKSFGSYRGAAGGTTSVNITGRVSTTKPLTGDVVLTDFLPADMTWENPATTLNFSLSNGSGPVSTATGDVEYLENYQGSGRNLIRITFDKALFTSGYYTLSAGGSSIRVQVPAGMMSYNNEARTYVQGIGHETAPTCGQGTLSTPADLESADPQDLDGDGQTQQNSCAWTATLNVPATGGPDFRLVKTVQGDQDDAPKYSPGIGEAAENGTGEWTLTWRNIGGYDLDGPVVYDILPYVGDTGTVEGQKDTPRGSEFQPAFTGINGSLPNGIAVEYSASTNPCRDEVFPNANNPTCVDDWSSTAPSDLSDVRALRFRASGTYQPGEQFTVKFGTRLPSDVVNLVAWNSGASSAQFNNNWQLPAEPPKVGITAPAPLVKPTLSTEVSQAKVVQGTSVSDEITIAGAKGASGTIAWKLVGPRPAVNGACATVDWTGAAEVASGTLPFSGDGDYDTPTSQLTAFGCYSYVVKATSSLFDGGEVSHPAGATNEVVQVAPVEPTLTTQVSKASTTPGDAVSDTITLVGADDAKGTIDWKLVGPKPAGTDGTCTDVDWVGADEVASGSLPFDGSGDYDTPTSAPTRAGCYSYVVKVDSPQFADPVSHPAGETNEVVQVEAATIVTEASSIRIAPGAEVTDRVELTGTGNGTGTLEWKLVGPIRANEEGTCQNLDWVGAQTFDSGTIAVDGDGTYVTDPSTPTETGCYSYVQLLTADSAGGPSLHAAGEPNEMVYVGRPTVETTVSSASIPTGGSLLDSIVVKGTGGGEGELQWKLYGPVVPGIGDTCLGLNWQNASVVAEGAIPVTGDGTYQTSATPPLLLAGCYGYEVTLDGKDYGGPVVSPAGTPGELSLVVAPVVPQQTARVSIEKSASSRSVRAGQRVTYTLTATNSGQGTAHNVVITDTPKSGMTFVSASAQQGSCSTGFPLSCNVGSIAPGGKVSVTVVAIPTVSGAVVNGARVTTDTPNESPANEVVADSRVTVKVPVSISKRAAVKTATAGKRVSFTVKVTNRSKIKTGRAQVCDRMPSGMVLVSVRGSKVTRKGGEHCWSVPALKPGQSKSYRVVARVLGGAKGTQTNRVTIKGTSVQTKSARASVRIKAKPVRAGGVTG